MGPMGPGALAQGGPVWRRFFFSGGILGETGLPKGLLGTIRSIPPARIPVEPLGEGFLMENHLFPGPIFSLKWSPAQPAHPGDQILDPGVKKSSPNPKITNLRAEKPCRIHRSEFQTEAYVASYGRKPYWVQGHQFVIWEPQRGKLILPIVGRFGFGVPNVGKSGVWGPQRGKLILPMFGRFGIWGPDVGKSGIWGPQRGKFNLPFLF